MYVRYYPRMHLINPYVAQTPLRARSYDTCICTLRRASDHHMLVAEFEFLD